MKWSESLWGGFWPLLRSTGAVFSLVCLQGQDDETEDCLGQLLSLPCQSVVVFSFCQRVFMAVLKTHSISTGGTERLSTTPAVGKEQPRGWGGFLRKPDGLVPTV